jgi:hypothetical protein|tara:strand:+ start:924 stop:1433 length:510 start_codon:yes stop_codon:yes gene_type:complete
MPWQNEMTIIVRHLVNDLDSTNYTFSDDRLEESILVSSQLSILEIDFEQTYTIEVDTSSLSPDPTNSSNKDDSFINLVSLKTAQMLIGSELKTHSLQAVAMRDGPSSIDLRGIVAGLKILFDDINRRYEEAVTQYKLNGVVGQAILGPYSPGSNAISRTNMSHRSGWFE